MFEFELALDPKPEQEGVLETRTNLNINEQSSRLEVGFYREQLD